MATFTRLTNAEVYAFANPVTTGTITPSSSSAAFIAIVVTFNASSAPSVSGLGLSWSLVQSQNFDADYDAFWFVGVGTATSGTASASGGGFEGGSMSLVEITNANVAAPIIASTDGSGTGTSLTATLGAFESASNQALISVVRLSGSGSLTPDDYTALASHTGIFGGAPEYWGYGAANDNALSGTWSATADWLYAIFEIDEVGGGGGGGGVSVAWLRA